MAQEVRHFSVPVLLQIVTRITHNCAGATRRKNSHKQSSPDAATRIKLAHDIAIVRLKTAQPP
jgi:hypothetical protein